MKNKTKKLYIRIFYEYLVLYFLCKEFIVNIDKNNYIDESVAEFDEDSDD